MSSDNITNFPHCEELLKRLSSGVIFTDADGRLISANSAAEKILGLKLDQLRGVAALDPRWKAMREDGSQLPGEEFPAMQALRLQATILDFTFWIFNPTLDAHVWIKASAFPQLDNVTGLPTGAYVLFEDITEKRGLQENLLEKTRLLADSQAVAGVGSWIANLDTGEVIWSEETYRIYGLSPEAQRSLHFDQFLELVHPEDRLSMQNWAEACISGQEPSSLEFRTNPVNGNVRWLLGKGRLERRANGEPWRMIGTVQDITERKEAEKLLRQSVMEKEALLQEVHHRVKNNLQVISSLLTLERRRSIGKETHSALEGMQSRIQTMALLYEALHGSETLAAIELDEHLLRIASHLMNSFHAGNNSLKIEFELDSVQVAIDQAISCGLLINELITNSFKHAFPDGQEGKVRIQLKPDGKDHLWRLEVSDNGVGLPADFKERKQSSLGLRLVHQLCQNLDGALEIGPGPGAEFAVTFRIEDISRNMHSAGSPDKWSER